MANQSISVPSVTQTGETATQHTEKVNWLIPIALFSCVLLAFFDKISIAALFSDEQFQKALGIDFDPTRLGLLMSAFLFSYGISSMLLSGIGDKFHPTKMLLFMISSWCILMIFMGFTHHYTTMVVLRVLLGIAEGPLLAISYAIVRRTFPQKMQARATMLWLLGTPIGAALGFPISIYLLHSFGWQSTFFVMAAFTVPVWWLVVIGIRHPNLVNQHAKKVDGKVSITELAETKTQRNILLRNSHFWIICLFNIAFLVYLWGMNGWLPSYLIKGKSINLEHAGILSSLPFIAMLFGEAIGAWLSDRYDRRALVCFISLLGAVAGLAGVLFLSTTYSIILMMAFSMFMWGAGAPNIFALLAKATQKQVSALAGGIFNGLGNLAGAAAPLLMGVLITLTHDMDSGLLFIVIIGLIGSVLLLPIIKKY
ncbi:MULTISPECIES: MFS transporter [Providencia]|uniref:MFS transporter n=1 Tax=Providencia stuartii TaxID=588 RepID=A0ABD5L4A3_PROST|nr:MULTISPECIES: MFS transporter [Providencia]ELR5044005.1 MFS transporter [Providencia rettgeri]ELR5292096.1 MFS transporter [Providencia stuartii]MCR4179870.1 MFS transporter [Providencia vermicola]URE77299.1 MFS transporter [Providencia stuartii]